jgi:hypothetical protein
MSAKVLLCDIETAPILAHVWGTWEQNVGLNQIHTDWHLLSWCAKWLGESRLMYMDQRHSKNVEDDKRILKGIWRLLDEADVVIWQNGRNFDNKKLNARFVLNGMQPPSSFRQIDTLTIARKHFGFTSNKLEYLSSKLCNKYKKQQHKKYPGFELWKECLAGNKDAWREMEKYNKHDVLALEELYLRLQPWDNTINFNVYEDSDEYRCACGSSKKPESKGFAYTAVGRYRRYRCPDCGAEVKGVENTLSKERKLSLMRKVVR